MPFVYSINRFDASLYAKFVSNFYNSRLPSARCAQPFNPCTPLVRVLTQRIYTITYAMRGEYPR